MMQWRRCYTCRDVVPAGDHESNEQGLNFCSEECKREHEEP